MLRGLLAGSFWGLVTGALVLLVAASVIENRRMAARVPPAAAVDTAPAGLGTPPVGAADGGTGPIPAAPQPVATLAAPARPEPTGPAEIRVRLEPPPGPEAGESVALAGAAEPAPATLPAIPAPTEVLSWLRAGQPRLDPRIDATGVAAVALPPPEPVGVAPAAVSGPQLAATRGDPGLPVAPRSDGDLPLRGPAPAAPAAPGFPPAPVLAGDEPDADRPAASAAPAGPRVAVVVLADGGRQAAPLPAWVRSVAGAGAAPGAETFAFADGAWRAGDLVLFPDRADPAPFLAARAAGHRAWLVYDRLDAAGPDLDARLAAARERARRDGAVVLLVAPDPALMARIGAWLADPGAPAAVPVSAL